MGRIGVALVICVLWAASFSHVSAQPLDLCGGVSIVRNFEDPEIAVLQGYLLDLGLNSTIFDQEGLTYDMVKDSELVIWDDLSFQGGGISDNDVHVFQSAFDAGTPLYFIGDDLAYSTINLSGPESIQWNKLTHLNFGSNFGGDGTVTIVDSSHAVTNGPAGPVANFQYSLDIDEGTQTLTGEVLLAESATAPVVLAFDDPSTKLRTVTQNVRASNAPGLVGFNAAGLLEAEKLFKNSVLWLLCRCPPPSVPVGECVSLEPVSSQAKVICLPSIGHICL